MLYNQWYSFDDASVSRVTHAQLAAHEAYVLFYRKVNPEMEAIRRKVAEIIESTPVDPNEVRYYISKQWIVKFNTWAEPGPIDNSDFVCPHGAVRPERARRVDALAAQLAAPAWRLLYRTFGGGPACTRIVECGHCARAAERLRARRGGELAAFYDLHAIFQEQERPRSVYAISMHWFRQWQAFVRSKTREPPPPVDNNGIVTKQETDGVTTFVLKQGSDHAQLSEELWRFFTEIYGGGPEVRLSGPPPAPADPAPAPRPLAHRPIRKQSESDKEEYCAKSTSETNINDMAQKNKSLQNIFNRRGRKQTESDDDVSYRQVQYKRHEPNGNYQDSDEEMDVSPPQNHTNTIRMENGVDSSDHDANDNPVHHNKKSNSNDVELPNLDSISLKAKPKSGKYRRSKRRTVK
ncbi:hypothetical protein JYU34_015273 [Plutella xylostella]|uniref:DUSP domain-containing protein n=1 Tax=Plutella xylostella TaxID=51655 RepID=A0ABQ7Q707_PLUXY|nr:hypothetical protein JYU34_015273 [Plutella xylostella]